MTPSDAVEGLRRAIAERAKARGGELSTIAVPLPVAIKVVQAFDEAEKRATKVGCCFTGVGQPCPIHEK